MPIENINTIDFPNLGIIRGHIDDASLTALKKEILEIQEDFSKGVPHNKELAGHIRKEYLLFKSCSSMEPLLVDLAERYHKKYQYTDPNIAMGNQHSFRLDSMWVNFQQKHEFNPLHRHGGLYSFVIWIDVPYFLNFEKDVSPGKQSIDNRSGMFEFTYINVVGQIRGELIPVDKAYEGDIILFPAALHHMVHPFYSSDKYRISVAGNITVNKND
jgi:hypothetical protein